jgi:hypothetical protein
MPPREQREVLIAYLEMKLQQQDWHGCADAACDLRELEAAHPTLRG